MESDRLLGTAKGLKKQGVQKEQKVGLRLPAVRKICNSDEIEEEVKMVTGWSFANLFRCGNECLPLCRAVDDIDVDPKDTNRHSSVMLTENAKGEQFLTTVL